MKTRMTVLGLVAAVMLAGWTAVARAEEPAKDVKGRLRHVVVFKFKEGTKAEDIQAIEKAFAKLATQVDTVIDYEWGTNVSPEGLANGFTHCFLVTFADAKGRDVYLPHPAHKAFGKLLGPHLEKAFVIDYVSK